MNQTKTGTEVERLREEVHQFGGRYKSVDALILAVRREQVEADCRVTCMSCERGDPVRFSEERNIFEHETSGRECDAFDLREAFANPPAPNRAASEE